MNTYPEMSVQAPEHPYVCMTASVTMGDFSPVTDRMPEDLRSAGGARRPTRAPP
jgi:hypothetical protein